MKFLYEYRTPDNEKHSGTINAADKEAAYAALKREGIKPCRFSEAPGFFNKLFGKGKRWMAIGVLGAGCLVLGVVAVRAVRDAQGTRHKAQGTLDRCQVYGDPGILQENESQGWTNVLCSAGDCVLAAFAQPGRGITAEFDVPVVFASARWKVAAESLAALSESEITFVEGEPEENRTMKRIVMGMRLELRQYLKDGGSAISYCERLLDRQREELKIRNRVVEELRREGASHSDFRVRLMEANENLRTMGMRTVTLQEVGALR